MQDTVPVVLHDIQNKLHWPENAIEIWRQFYSPLPQCLLSENVQERFSVGACELYEEALQSPLMVLRGEEPPARPVTDVIDTVLSYVRMVKTAISFDAGDEQARASWISILTVLGTVISKDVFILEDVPFLRTRTQKKSKVSELEDVEGKALVLLSSLLPRPCTEEDAMDVCGAESYSEDSIPHAFGDSLQPIGVPFDAHILPGRGKRLNCLLPVVCAADESDVEALLTSVACQRFVLNITQPVVGISLPASGTTAKVVIGWTKANGQDEAAPTVHLAYAQDNVNQHPSVGVFDLLNPASVLYFAQFILNLQHNFSLIKECPDSLETRNFCWRLDHVNYEHPIRGLKLSNEISWTEIWVYGLASTEISGHCKSPFDDAMPPRDSVSKLSNESSESKQSSLLVSATGPSQGTRAKRKAHRGDSKSQPSQSNLGASLKPQTTLKSKSDDQNSGELRVSQATSNASRYGASEFARLNPKMEDMENGTETWLWERNTIRLHRVRFDHHNKSELEEQIDEMIAKYNFITRICWPASWRRVTDVPTSDGAYGSLRTELFEDYKEYVMTNAESLENPNDKILFAMESDVCLSISQHMSALFKAIASARACERLINIGEAPESTMRSIWDDLLKVTCCEAGDAVSTCFFHEKVIPLPKNIAVEHGSAFPGSQQAQLLVNLVKKQISATPSEMPIAAQLALSAAHFHALCTQSAIQKAGPVATGARTREPAQATVDGICCLEVDLRQPLVHHEETRSSPQWWMTPFIKLFSKQKRQCEGKLPGAGEVSGKARHTEAALHLHCYACPAVNPPSFSSSSYAVPPIVASQTVYIPSLFAEYKRATNNLHQAFHQVQMYCIFGVEFLAAIGITDHPVWGLVTSGCKGAIVMTWKSTKSTDSAQSANSLIGKASNRYNIMIDRYTQTFDLTQPLQTLQLMACLHRLYRLQDDLREKVKAQLGLCPRLLTDPRDPILNWMPKPPPRNKKGKGDETS